MNKQQLDYFPLWINQHTVHLSMIRNSLHHWMLMSSADESRRGGARPMGIVFDLDEVLVSPFPLQEPSLWRFFPHLEKTCCPAYPGAVDLVNKCHDLGLMVFFVTARTHGMRATTVAALAAVGLAADVLVMMKEGDPPGEYKTTTRKEISTKCRLIASIGDQLTDLGNYTDVNYLIPNPFYRSGSYSS